MKKITMSLLAIAMGGCFQPQPYNDSAALASAIDLGFELTSNNPESSIDCAKLGAEWATCNQFDILLSNNDNGVMNNEWTLYIHSIRRILDSHSEQVDIEHITGDLYQLKPTSAFTPLLPGESLRIPLIGEFFFAAKTDFIPGAFIVDKQGATSPLVWQEGTTGYSWVGDIPDKQTLLNADDKTQLTSASKRYDDNLLVNSTPDLAHRVFPTPLSASFEDARLTLTSGINIEKLELSPRSADYLIERFNAESISTQGQTPLLGVINANFFQDELATTGAYRLDISQEGIAVIGFDEAGLFYGMNSLLSLINENSLPLGVVTDAPRFNYRGVMIDLARNFHSKEFILELLDEMSHAKLNKLALHLSDDEGWRLEIDGLEELTSVGAKRCFDLTETQCLLPQLGSSDSSNNWGSGFLSKQDFVDILVAADARHIEIIPEFDMPAHARAAVVSMEARHKRLVAEGRTEEASQFRLIDPQDQSNVTTVQYYDRRSFINPCLDSSLAFTQKVMHEVSNLYADASVPLRTWHFGGDEAKNIKLGNGFTDQQLQGKGQIDLAQEDFPFAKSPACQKLVDSGAVESFSELPSYWAQKTSKLAHDIGYANFQAWEDGLKYLAGPQSLATNNASVNFWETLSADGDENAYKWAEKGYDLIISVPDYLYFDFPQAIDPEERGLYWATRANTLKKVFAFAPENLPQNAANSLNRNGEAFIASSNVPEAKFKGMSVQLWSELIRNDEQAEYMVYPRLYAAAERAWSKGSWELPYTAGASYTFGDERVDISKIDQAYGRFVAQLGQSILPRIEDKGIEFRLPLAGAKLDGNILSMNSEIPALQLEYSLDDGKVWQVYIAPVEVTAGSKVLVRTATEQRKGRATTL